MKLPKDQKKLISKTQVHQYAYEQYLKMLIDKYIDGVIDEPEQDEKTFHPLK